MYQEQLDAMKHQLMRRGTTCTQTKLEEYIDPQAATTTIRIAREPATEENRQKMAHAVAVFLTTATVAERQQATNRGKVKYTVIDRPAVPTDVFGVNLYLHETSGPHKGDDVEEPWVAVTLGSGVKHHLWLSGKVQRRCAFCKQSHEPLRRDVVSRKQYHIPCLDAAKKKALDQKEDQSLERRLLAATGD